MYYLITAGAQILLDSSDPTRKDGSTCRNTSSVCSAIRFAKGDGIAVDVMVGARQSGSQPGNPAGPPSLARRQRKHGTSPMAGPRRIHLRANPDRHATSDKSGWYAEMDRTTYIGTAPLANCSSTLP